MAYDEKSSRILHHTESPIKMASILCVTKASRTLHSQIYKHDLEVQIISHSATDQEFRIIKRANATLNDAWVRVVVIFSFVILFSLIAALVGCIIASCHGKRRRILRTDEPSSGQIVNSSSSRLSNTSSSDHSSDYDVEMLGQLDTIMASHTFRGREWNVYKKEMRKKAKRQAHGFARTSQGISSPIDVRHLKSKMGALSRSLIQSVTRSEAIQEPLPDLAALDEILEALKNTTNVAPSTTGLTQNVTSETLAPDIEKVTTSAATPTPHRQDSNPVESNFIEC